ncbi:phosphotransferase [uncultured Photobacterium sp.]|uniref:phosphotransferase n=1 Tax=uncultured Photobacterium sp. TaxID=173973 RepID=UPI002626B8CB|nr:phosphotransferase [uncultured Photobacterium sp.]
MIKPQLKQIAESAYQTIFGQRPDLCNFQETFYGWVVFVASPHGAKVVVKFSREIGRQAKEIQGLSRLSKVLACPVPEVLFFGREEGYDYIMLEWVKGESAHKLPNDPAAVESFRESYTNLLLALHEHQASEGFEVVENEFTPCLIKAYESWMSPVLRYVQSSCSPFSSELKDIYSTLWERKEEILSPINHHSSLVHDDCHVGNILFDQKTYQVSAIVDPCDVGYKHREFDLFHLYDVRPDLQLVERYQESVQLAEGFDCRRWFLSLWDDAKHSRNMGWYDEQWLLSKANRFEESYSCR